MGTSPARSPQECSSFPRGHLFPVWAWADTQTEADRWTHGPSHEQRDRQGMGVMCLHIYLPRRKRRLRAPWPQLITCHRSLLTVLACFLKGKINICPTSWSAPKATIADKMFPTSRVLAGSVPVLCNAADSHLGHQRAYVTPREAMLHRLGMAQGPGGNAPSSLSCAMSPDPSKLETERRDISEREGDFPSSRCRR